MTLLTLKSGSDEKGYASNSSKAAWESVEENMYVVFDAYLRVEMRDHD